MPVALYNQYGSPPCAFVRMVARHVGVDLELRNLDMFKGDHVTPEYLKLNPYHKAPTIDDNGFILYESSAIAYYLINKYAPSSTLCPSCPKLRAQVDQVLATVTSTIQPHYFAFFKPRFFDLKHPTPEEFAAFEENVLGGLQNHVGKDGGYAVGDSLTLADLTLLAHLTLCQELPVLRRDRFPRLRAFYTSVKTTLPYFDEINNQGIDLLNERLEGLK
ncbi:glutathione S-transferase 4-like [Dermacentor variabilis]|uniref:glutathione S-transferase 4-like n=1 Tax=Dermacentor variabilis TaxID=34621 RepID=UPI003F5CA3B7